MLGTFTDGLFEDEWWNSLSKKQPWQNNADDLITFYQLLFILGTQLSSTEFIFKVSLSLMFLLGQFKPYEGFGLVWFIWPVTACGLPNGKGTYSLTFPQVRQVYWWFMFQYSLNRFKCTPIVLTFPSHANRCWEIAWMRPFRWKPPFQPGW